MKRQALEVAFATVAAIAKKQYLVETWDRGSWSADLVTSDRAEAGRRRDDLFAQGRRVRIFDLPDYSR